MRISTPDSVRTAVLLLRYLVEVIDATIFLGTPFAAFTCASVALGTSSAPQAQFFPLSSRRATRSATAYRCAEIHPQRSRRPSLSLALALCFPSCRSPRVAIDTRRASASRASRSLTPRLARGTHESAIMLRKSFLCFY